LKVVENQMNNVSIEVIYSFKFLIQKGSLTCWLWVFPFNNCVVMNYI
jgi:hypothetical protein